MTIALFITAYLAWGLLMALAIIWIVGRFTDWRADEPGAIALASMLAWPIFWPAMGVIVVCGAVGEAWKQWWGNWEKRSRGKGGRK